MFGPYISFFVSNLKEEVYLNVIFCDNLPQGFLVQERESGQEYNVLDLFSLQSHRIYRATQM